MIYTVKRFSQKEFSLNVLSLGKQLIKGPLKIIKGVWDFFRGMASKIKHHIPGKPVKEHTKTHPEEGEITKQFSDSPEYCKIIPGYEELSVLSSLNFKILKPLGPEGRKFIYKYFPSFLLVVDPETINRYREDFRKKYGQDYSEIMYAFGGEMDFLWDFDKEKWYAKDTTYNPAKEYEIRGNDILGALSIIFDPTKNKLLRARLEMWESDEYLSGKFDMRKYCETILKMLNTVKK